MTALKLLKNTVPFQEVFGRLGSDWTISEELMEQIETFTCRLYGSLGNVTDINDCRYRLFCSRKGEIESYQLPPCRDCLQKHTKRANYQSAVWRCALEGKAPIPSPHQHGWIISDLSDGSSNITIDWMNGPPAPMAVLELLACQCKKQCAQDNCPCILNGLQCTEMCKLNDCNNRKKDDDLDAVIMDQLDAYSDEEDDTPDETPDDCVISQIQQHTVFGDDVEEQFINIEEYEEIVTETSSFIPMDE